MFDDNRFTMRRLAWNRVVEWLLVALLLTVLIGVFVRHVREVRGLGELAAIKASVGALRTALVIDHLRRQTGSGLDPLVMTPLNPFELLAQQPVNYWGVVLPARIDAVPAGSWVYVAQCPCVGYRPLDDLWLGSPSGEPMIWYVISGMPGILQLTPKERYHWHIEALD